MKALLLILLTLPFYSYACETPQCRADRGHNMEGAFVGLAASTILDRYNGADKKLLTFIETVAISAAISAATEQFVGRHGHGFNNRDFLQRFGGGVGGGLTFQVLRMEW